MEKDLTKGKEKSYNLNEIGITLYSLIAVLIKKGVLTEEDFEGGEVRQTEEMKRKIFERKKL